MEKTISAIIEEACNDFCDNFCKYSEQMQGMTDEAYDKMLCTVCEEKCPINKLI